MSLPNLPPFIDMIYTDKEGKLTPNALLYNDEMNNTLRVLLEQFNELVMTSFASNDFVNKGLLIPNATTAEITAYRDDLQVPVGATWFNTNLAKLQVKTVQAIVLPPTAGVIETIQSA